MSETSCGPDLFNELAHEFAERYRRGERPPLCEYTAKYPALAAEIRELFPALVMMEEFGSAGGGSILAAAKPAPEQLGEYRILREVARGGMGIVYEAVQESLGRHVALKVVPCQSGGGEPLERFRREAKTAARLHHSNIVPVFGVGEHQGIHYYAMQFIHGETVASVLEEVKRLRRPAPTAFAEQTMKEPDSLPVALDSGGDPGASTAAILGSSDTQYFRNVARVGLQAAEALDYAHQQGVLHRDVKPANLLLDTQGTVWVTDFGLAKEEGTADLTRRGDLVGTLRYMAPERFQGQADARSDVYALGLTLYEMLTLRPAYDLAERAQLIERVVHEEPRRPRRLDPRIPRDLETVVLKTMRKEPERRYASAGELAEDLRRFLSDRPVRARRTSTLERVWRLCRRNPLAAALSTAILLLLLVIMAGALVDRARLSRAFENEQAKHWESLRDRARAMRMSRRPGQRLESLQSIAEAMRLPLPPGHSLTELRTEAVAALALPDIEAVREWEGGLTPGIISVDFDGNLEQYAQLARDGTLTVRRADDDQLIARWEETAKGDWRENQARLRFSRDGRYLAVWHAGSQRLVVRQLDGPHPALCYSDEARGGWVDFSSDGRKLVHVLPDTRVAVVDLASGQARQLPPTDGEQFCAIELAPDGRRLAMGVRRQGKHAVEVRDLATGQIQSILPHPKSASPRGWHQDGRTLATSCQDGLIRLWDVATGKFRILEGHKRQGITCCFDSTGQKLVSNDWDGILRLWETSSSRQLLSIAADGYSLLRVSPDNRLAVRKLGDSTTLRLLRIHGGREYQTIVLGARPVRDWPLLNVDATGRLIAVRTHDHLALVDLATARQVARLPSGGALLAEPASGQAAGALLTAGKRGLYRWPLQIDTGETVKYRFGPPAWVLGGNTDDTWGASTDGKTIAFPRLDQGAIVMHRGLAVRGLRLQPQQGVRRCAVSPDGRWVATGSHGSTDGFAAKVWEAATGKLVKSLPLAVHCEVAFSPNGRWLLTSAGGCRLWQAGTWTEGPVVGGAKGCFSPDSRLVAVEDSLGVIRLVETDTGVEVVRLEAPEQTRLVPGCFTPDGTRLIAVGVDTQALHVWDLRELRRQLAPLGLDWDAPPYTPGTVPPALCMQPLEVTVDLGNGPK